MMDLEFNLHPAQMEVFNDPSRFKLVAAGRRFGKSYLARVELIINALKEVNEAGYNVMDKEVWYVAPTFQQAKDIMWNPLKEMCKDITESTVENTATLRLINGRTIKLKGSDRPDTLRGVGISYVVLDEYAFMKPDVWDVILRPTLADVEGSALFIGTPEGKNHFYDLFVGATKHEDWKAFTFTSFDNPYLSNKELMTAKSTMSSAAFRQEHLASFESGGAGIFKEEWIVLDSEEPEGVYYIAVDPAGYEDVQTGAKGGRKKLDETAIAIVKVGPSGWWVKDIIHGRWDIRETSLRIMKAARDVRPALLGIEAGALKNAIMPYLEDQMRRLGVFPVVVPLTHGGKKKTDRISWALQGRMEHGRLKFNEGHYFEHVKQQFLDFPSPLAHDDLIDALAYIDQLAVPNYNEELELPEWEPLDEITGY